MRIGPSPLSITHARPAKRPERQVYPRLKLCSSGQLTLAEYATVFIERQELALRSMASFTPVLSSSKLSRAKAPHAHATLKKILMASTTPAEPLAAAQTILTEVCAPSAAVIPDNWL